MEVGEADCASGLDAGVFAVHGKVRPLVAGEELLRTEDGCGLREEPGDVVNEAVNIVKKLLVRERLVVLRVAEVVDLAFLVSETLDEDGLVAVHGVLRRRTGRAVSEPREGDFLEFSLSDHREGDVVKGLRKDVLLDDVLGDRHLRLSLALLVEIEQP